MALFGTSAIGAIGGQAMLISAFVLGLNFTSAIYPSGTVMGTLELYKIPYDIYLKFSLKVYPVMLVVGCLLISLSRFLGL